MSARFVSIVAAVARNGAIGYQGTMPWHLPDELRHFRRLTMGKPVIMGRKTFEAIGQVLPGRQNIVVSRNPTFDAQGATLADSFESGLGQAESREVMVIGGGELYRMALPRAGRLFLTIVDCAPQADTWFPSWSQQQWRLVGAVVHAADERHEYGFEMQEWLRRAPRPD